MWKLPCSYLSNSKFNIEIDMQSLYNSTSFSKIYDYSNQFNELLTIENVEDLPELCPINWGFRLICKYLILLVSAIVK